MSANSDEPNIGNKISNITFKKRQARNFNRTNKRDETKFKNKNNYDKKYPLYNNNNHNSNNSKNKDDDDEKSAFMTKDQLEEFISKSYIINYYFILILVILFFVTIIIITIKLAFAKTNFSLTSYLTNGMIFIEEIKADI